MKRIIPICILIIKINSLFSQDSIPVIKKQISSSFFVDCYSYKNGLAALAKDGKIYQINLTDFSFSTLSPYSYSTIGTDRKGMLWAADSFSSVYSLRDTGWKREKIIAARTIWALVFTQDNSLFLLTDLGIYNSKTEMFYGVNKYRQYLSSFFPRHRYQPACFYMDDKNNLWIGSYSRIGKELHVFSTKKNSFITSNMKGFVWFIDLQSIFGYKKTVFFTELETIAGMSSIYSYKKDTMLRIHHPEYDTMNSGPPKGMEEYIGGAFFDKNDRSVCYYSNKGLFKAKYNEKKNKLEEPDKITAPVYVWDGYEMNSSRFAMLIKKIFQIQNLIIFLNKEEGIFVYNGILYYNLK